MVKWEYARWAVLCCLVGSAAGVVMAPPRGASRPDGRLIILATRVSKARLSVLAAVRTRGGAGTRDVACNGPDGWAPAASASTERAAYDVDVVEAACEPRSSAVRVGSLEVALPEPAADDGNAVTACLSPLYGAGVAEKFELYARYYRALGVDRFAVFDPTAAAPALGGLSDVEYGNWSFQAALGAGADRGPRARTLAGLQLALRFCAFRFAGVSRLLLLNFDLDEFLSCDFFVDDRARRSVGAAVAHANGKPWFRKRPRRCVCFPRVLYNGTGGRVPVGLQNNRKCAVDPAALSRVSLHAPTCRGSAIHVDHGDACRVHHRRPWTGPARRGRPVDDGVLVADRPPVTDLDWWDLRGAVD